MTFEEYDKVVEVVASTGDTSLGHSSFGQGYEACRNDVLQAMETELWAYIDKKELEKRSDE